MKSIKFIFVMAALAATLSFVSCNNGDDDGDDGVVAIYESKNFGTVKSTHTIIFLDDGTWTWKVTLNGQSKDEMSGIYTGDPSKDGSVTITITKSVIENDGELVDVSKDNYKEKLTISDGKTTYDGMTFIRQ